MTNAGKVTLKQNMLKIMDSKGITPKDLAEKLNVSYTVVYRYLNYKRTPKKNITRIAECLGVTAEDLLKGIKKVDLL